MASSKRADAARAELGLGVAAQTRELVLVAAGAAHLLNNVTLTVASQLLLAEGALGTDAGGVEELETARRALELNTLLARRLSALAQAHGVHARVERDVAHEVADGIAKARHRVGASEVPIEAHVVTRLARVAPPALSMVTEELVANALEAGARGVRVRASARADHLVLRVEDDGAGMTKELARRAADPFVTTRPRAQHCGIGLTLVRAWTRGRYRIAPRANGGTTVSASLRAR
ncbi:MAG: sensor histidine kinase [Sandaracinaceae bacterium]|nr:sensor histidine kinase [Sandaracinaceae bacterium]